MNIVPPFIRRRITHRPNLLRIVDNIGWLFFDKILRMGVGLLVGVWVARYLGPQQFGLFSYATAFIGMFGNVAGLGLQSIVVRDIVRDPNCKEETLGTAAVLQLGGGVLAYGLVLSTIYWLRPDDALAKWLVAILGSVMLLKASEVAVYWFESQVLSKYTVWVQNGSFLVFAAVKVALILGNAPLLSFAWATMAEAALVALLLLAMLGLHGPGLRKLKVSLGRAKVLLADSWPLLLSGIAIMVNMKIDQIMLGKMINDEAVGVYSAAVRISEVWYFVIGIVMTSIFPSIVNLHVNNDQRLHRQWAEAYGMMFWISVCAAITLTFLSSFIVKVLFGVAYSKAASVLIIYAWAGISVAVGTVWSSWLLLEKKMKLGLMAQIIAAFLNIILNLLLVPIYGIEGAAVATLLSYTASGIVSYFFHKPATTLKYIRNGIFFRKSS